MIAPEHAHMTTAQLVNDAKTHHGADLGRLVYGQARNALRGGVPREELIATLTAFYEDLGRSGQEDDQDAIAEVLDSLTGFSSPTATL